MAKKRYTDQAERAVIYMYCGRISRRLRALGIEKTPDEICARAALLREPVGLLKTLRNMWLMLRLGCDLDLVWGGPEWDISREPHRDAA